MGSPTSDSASSSFAPWRLGARLSQLQKIHRQDAKGTKENKVFTLANPPRRTWRVGGKSPCGPRASLWRARLDGLMEAGHGIAAGVDMEFLVDAADQRMDGVKSSVVSVSSCTNSQ